MRHGAHEALVVAGGQRRRPRAGVGQIERLEHRRDVQLLERVVVEALVAQVEHEIGAQLRQIAVERGVIVEIAELVGRQLRQRVLAGARIVS